ncbi:MAG TPA: ADP-ribosylglycohydrolase family protein, partial [Micromonosporaceae bacterium]
DGPMPLPGDPAQVSDDTQMALAVGWALHEAPAWTAPVVEPLLRRRFLAWATSPDNDRAPGQTCLRACAALADGRPWQRASVAGSKGCGANMRVTPVGLLAGIDDETLAGLAQLQAGLTHGHPTGLAAAELTAYAVKVIAGGAELPDVPELLRMRCHDQRDSYRHDWLGELWQATGAPSAVEYIRLGWDECSRALDRLDLALAAPDRRADPCRATGAGWVAEEALATSLLCALLYPDDPVGALSRAARTCGDSDSIACLTGAYLGAAHGMAAWPDGWVDRIEYRDQLASLGRAFDDRARIVAGGR